MKMRRAPSLAPNALRSRPSSSVASRATRVGAVRVVAMAPPRKAAPKKDVVLTPSHLSARDGDGPYPLDSGGAGWDAVELYDLTGLCWSFTTPSSTEGRRIVKAACERKGMALKGYSDWRKEDWAEMAAKAGVDLKRSFAVVAGMRGFRVCWAPHGVALMYVPGVRRFYTVADIANGAADDKADRPAAEVVKAFEAVGRVKKDLAEAYAIATDPAAAASAAVAANSGDASPTGESPGDDSSPGGADNRQQTNAYQYPNPRSCVAKWCVGQGVDAASRCTPNTESVSTFTAPRARCLVPWSPRSPPTRARPCQPTRTPSGSRRTGSTPWNGSTLRTSRRTPRSPRLVGAGKCAGWKTRSASGARRSWCGRPSGTRTTRWVP